MIKQTCARYMYGTADSLFPQNINRMTYEPLYNAYDGSGKISIDQQSGVGHTTTDNDFSAAATWLTMAKGGNCPGTSFPGAEI